jgi:hypothetical protein
MQEAKLLRRILEGEPPAREKVLAASPERCQRPVEFRLERLESRRYDDVGQSVHRIDDRNGGSGCKAVDLPIRAACRQW